MSWSGYIPGDLIRDVWEREIMEDLTGTNIISESLRRFQPEENAPEGESVPSSSEVEALLAQATTALRQALEAAYKVRAQEEARTFRPAAAMTPEQVPVSPFMQRLTLYCGLIGTFVMELRSIAPNPPVMDAGGSSRPQESAESSRREARPLSRRDIDELDPMSGGSEPSIGAVVVDESGDVWQRHYSGWTCSTGGANFRDWGWSRLNREFSVKLILEGRGW